MALPFHPDGRGLDALGQKGVLIESASMHVIVIVLINVTIIVQLLLLGRRGLHEGDYPLGHLVAACFSIGGALGWSIPGSVFEWAVSVFGSLAETRDEFILKMSIATIMHLIAGSYLGFKMGAFLFDPRTGSLSSAILWQIKIVLFGVVCGILISFAVDILAGGFAFKVFTNSSGLLRASVLGIVDGLIGAGSIVSLAGPVARRLFETRP
jgi:hypothetical protein